MWIYLNGLLFGLTLITALGPQNIFLIRQGARRKHAVLSALICFACDCVLVIASVTSLHHIIQLHPNIRYWLTWFGVIFLFCYGGRNLLHALRKSHHNDQRITCTASRWKIVLLALGFSLLNPHAIIDSIIIIGSGSSQYPDNQPAFVGGVITASLIWFTLLTVITHFFAKLLGRAKTWRRMELASGLLMLGLSLKLAWS